MFISFLISVYIYFDRKVVKKHKEKIHRAFKRSELSEALEKCEAGVFSKREHENLIKYYEFFIEEDQICIVLEAFDIVLEKFLENYFKTNEKIDKELAIKWLKQLVSGVKHLHSNRCHHKDLKPMYFF